MAGKIEELTGKNFEQVTSKGVVLLDFWAPWCGPCMMQGPILEDVASRIGDEAIIAKVNVDDAHGVSARFGIRAIPTIVIMKDGQVISQAAGVQSAEKLIAALSEAAAAE